jgi:hypothetical protein
VRHSRLIFSTAILHIAVTDQGKPVERRGRKATGLRSKPRVPISLLAAITIAGLPGCTTRIIGFTSKSSARARRCRRRELMLDQIGPQQGRFLSRRTFKDAKAMTTHSPLNTARKSTSAPMSVGARTHGCSPHSMTRDPSTGPGHSTTQGQP